MYEEHIKLEFLDKAVESDKTRAFYKNKFKTLEKFEIEYKSDIANMDMEQTLEAFRSISGTNSTTSDKMCIDLRRYANWRRANGYPTTNSLYTMEYDNTPNFKDAHVFMPINLKMSLDVVFGDLDKAEIGYIYRSYLWLAYMGICEEDVSRIRVQDVDFDEMKIRVPDLEYSFEIYTESLPDLKKACTLSSFRENASIKERVSGDLLLRCKKTDRIQNVSDKVLSFRQAVSRVFKKAQDARLMRIGTYAKNDAVSLNLSYSSIRDSGMFYRAYQQESIGNIANFRKLVRLEYEGDPDYTHDTGDTPTSKVRYMAYARNKDYEMWKHAFIK